MKMKMMAKPPKPAVKKYASKGVRTKLANQATKMFNSKVSS